MTIQSGVVSCIGVSSRGEEWAERPRGSADTPSSLQAPAGIRPLPRDRRCGRGGRAYSVAHASVLQDYRFRFTIIIANSTLYIRLASMIPRDAFPAVTTALDRQAAVGLIGPRQVGKTTLAMEIAERRDALYLDLESSTDRAKLADPNLFLGRYENRLVVLDEIHRAPQLFGDLRGLIDRGRRRGRRTGRFLILGSASIDLLRQSAETLAGRIEFVRLNPFSVAEIEHEAPSLVSLWCAGGSRTACWPRQMRTAPCFAATSSEPICTATSLTWLVSDFPRRPSSDCGGCLPTARGAS